MDAATLTMATLLLARLRLRMIREASDNKHFFNSSSEFSWGVANIASHPSTFCIQKRKEGLHQVTLRAPFAGANWIVKGVLARHSNAQSRQSASRARSGGRQAAEQCVRLKHAHEGVFWTSGVHCDSGRSLCVADARFAVPVSSLQSSELFVHTCMQEAG